MIKNYFDDRLRRRARSSERAEAMPAAIITAIVSTLLLLGIASVVSLVVQNKSNSQDSVNIATVASNIDVSLRSDVTSASYLTASAKLKQPAGRLLTPTDITLSGVNIHVPAKTGECKVIRWSINGTTASRDLTIYKFTSKAAAAARCDETSPIVAKRTKVFADNVNVKAPFKFHNQVGRELSFTHADPSLTTINSSLNSQLTAKNVQRLSDADFNELNKQLTSSSFAVGFTNPAACVMNAAKVNGACPDPEANSVTAAWNSLKIAKVSVAFEMSGASGSPVKRDIEQNSSVPLYTDAAEAQGAVADSSTDNKPVPVIPNVSNSVILGNSYTVSWTIGGVCPVNMSKTYKVYENGLLVNTTAGTSFTKTHTNSADEYVDYVVQIECVRGALVVSSDMSTVARAKVIPAVPALVINQQPLAFNAALNSPIVSTATCLYGTSPRYNLVQVLTSFGAPGSGVANLTSVNRAINNGFSVVEGARYQYRVEAWCISAFDKSLQTATSTNTFTTLINTPNATVFTAPSNNAMKVPTNATVSWSASTCAVGTTVKYYVTKNVDAGAAVPAQILENWTANTNLASNNNQGSAVGYTLQARCEGSAAGVNSLPTSTVSLRYTTLVNLPITPQFMSPADTATGIATNATVSWTVVSCAPFTTVQYYTTKNVDAGATLATPTVINNWTSGTSLTSNNTEGSTVGYTVQARCVGSNDASLSTGADTVKYTTRVGAPSTPQFSAPADNATGIATNAAVTWSTVTCAAGTTVKYYTTKNVDAGATLASPAVINNWSGGTSLASNNTQGNTVGYTVAARCDGPNAVSASSATDNVRYTTLINAPAAVAFTSPADNATGVAIKATATWTSVTCATGTTTKYYSYKDMAAGAVIAPIVIDNWTTDTSYTTSNFEGQTVRYNVRARCDGPNAVSANTATDVLKYTTVINMPAAVTATNNGWSTVSWGAQSCAAQTTIKYRVWQVKQDNNASTARSAWTTALLADLPTTNTGGYPQWAQVEALCDGANADSAVRSGANTTKWVKMFTVSFSAERGKWRRINFDASCPASTTLGAFRLYVAADGWGGPRYSNPMIQTDEGYWIYSSGAGPGGNSGWVVMNATQNTQWIDTTRNWGVAGNRGWGSQLSGNSMWGTYWNATGWGTFQYWWYGSCSTNYMIVGAKGSYYEGSGGIRNKGVPETAYDAARNGASLTAAGANAIK